MPVVSKGRTVVLSSAGDLFEELIPACVDTKSEHVFGRGEIQRVHESMWVGEGALGNADPLG